MGKKENRPDACTASGTASTCDYDSTFVSAGQDMTENELIRKVTEEYLAGIDADIRPAPEQVERELLQATNNAIEAYNLGPRDPSAPVGATQKEAYPDQKMGEARLRLRKHLDPYQIALVVRELHHAVGILWKDAGDDGNFDIGVYQTSGDNEGTYDVSEDGLTRLIRSYDSAITIRGVYETIAVLRSVCPHVERCHDRDLIAVNNGVYDYGSKMLLGFDPEFVFTGKVRVDFVNNAKNPVIHNDEDGTDWDVVSWMGELSDDESIVRLLWQIVGAVIRPGVSWNKSAWFYSTSGNNGKGTLCSLMRNLLGRGSWESISLKDFSSPFMLEPLMRISAVITDENDTGTFVDDAAALKSIITGDPFQLNRKFKEPRTVLFKGFMVQCVNELPRLRDRSESMYRRLLVVPFEKRFEGNERKYIKDDYLKRKEVLEYVLYKLLAKTDYYELDVPQACVDMLEEFKLENDPVRQFAEEVFAEATWDLLPYKFMYDCYRHWFQRNVPSGRPVGRNAFLKSLKGLSAEYGWLAQDKVRSDGRMDKPEPLILEYDVREWMNSGYTGSDPGRKCMPDLAESYRGFVRVSTAGSGDSEETDSEDKEE